MTRHFSMPARPLRVLKPIAAALVLAGIANPGSAQDQDKEVLQAVPYADLRNLDPVWTTAIITRHHAYMIYDTLFAKDENLEPQPQMVGEWDVSEDGMTYTFTLRDGLLFHDGSPVTAADAVASIERWAARDSTGGALMDVTASLEPVDDKTFRLVLSEPYGLVIDSLAALAGPFVMPKEVAETDPFEQIQDYTGSGPFMFNEQEWVPGNKVVYDRFEDYVPRDEPPSGAAGGKVANVDRVVWSYLPDPATALAAMQTGEIDFWEAPPVDLLPVLEANPDVEVGTLDPLGLLVLLRPNHLHPPFDKKEARQALAYMADQSEYMTAMVGNPEYWQECPSLMMCNTPGETTAGGGERMVASDMEKAKELMDQVYQGEKVIIMHPTDHPSGPVALVTAEKLRELGVNVELQAMDWATLTSRRSSKNPPEEGGWSIFHTRTPSDTASPATHTQIATGETAWFGWPSDERIEELRIAWGKEPDPEKRRQILEQMHELAMDYQPFVTIGQYQMPSAWRSNITGQIKSPVLGFWNLDVE